jgi:hypothetical protein
LAGGRGYIGRTAHGWPRSKWANPFVIDHDGTREEVIDLYEHWLKGYPKGQRLLRDIGELREGFVVLVRAASLSRRRAAAAR